MRRVYRLPGRRMEHLFVLMFRLQKAGSSKYSASRQRTDRHLMPRRFDRLYAVALAGAFWGFQVFT